MNKHELIKKYSGAKEIYALMRRKKMSKMEIVFDWAVCFFTPLPGIVDDADYVSDMGTYYLVVGDNGNKLVRVMGKNITEQDITVNCKKRMFIVDGNRFVKVAKLNGK